MVRYLVALLLAVILSLPAIPQMASANAQNYVTPYPVYQFASWQGNGIGLCQSTSGCNPTDSYIQQSYQTTGSMIYPWGGIGYANWCGGANTTSTNINTFIPGSGNSIYNSAVANQIVNYQMPYLIEEPVDGYGNCDGWASATRLQYPDLITYNSQGLPITSPRITANDGQGSYVRVDDLNFGKQLYNDMVNIKNNLKSTNPNVLQYWYGLDISSVASDWGGYPSRLGGHFPNFMLGPASVTNFAQSSFCTASIQCANLLVLASGGTSNIPQMYTILTQGCQYLNNPPTNGYCSSGMGYQFIKFTNTEQLLGISYAAYNFSQRYMPGKQFMVQAAYDGLIVSPSQYPAPYNKPYIQGLNLLQNYVLEGQATVEGGGTPPTQATVTADLQNCKSNAPYGNPGGYLAAASSGPYAAQYLKNDMYYTAACTPTSTIQISGFGYTPSSPGWNTMYGFGQLLNRMKNLGVSTVSPFSFTKNAFSTGLTAISKNGMTLAWFYTNSTSGDTASATFLMGGGCTAISALDWSVLGKCNGASVSMTAKIPARGWNPVYIVPSQGDTNILYSNINCSGSGGSYNCDGPHQLSGWVIIQRSTQPNTVSTTVSGTLVQASSLAALNTSYVGQQYLGYTFIGKSETQWYYDSGNDLLYIHYQVGSPVVISLNGVSTQTTTTVTSTICTSSNIIIGAITTTTVSANCTTTIDLIPNFNYQTFVFLGVIGLLTLFMLVRRRKE